MPAPRDLRRAAQGLLAVVVGVNVVGFALLFLTFPSLLWSPDDAPASQQKAQPADKGHLDGATSTPAQTAVDRVMRTTPAGLGRAWRATSESGGVPSLPAVFDCGREQRPAPVISATRGWVKASGPLPEDVESSVRVTARAYSAGGGGLALKHVREQADGCASTSEEEGPDLGVQSLVVDSGDESSLLWRRGDVVMVATTRGIEPGSMRSVWRSYDRRLRTALRGVCADPSSSVRDARRSPMNGREQFTGRTKGSWVTAPRVPAERVPKSVRKVAIPGPDVGYTVPRYMDRPAAPISPAGLPAYQSRPDKPDAPDKPAKRMRVGLRVEDPTGPGCGWKFTGQVEPAYDATKARTHFVDDRAEAARTLEKDWQQWQRDRVEYYEDYADYVDAMAGYSAYAQQVNSITDQWSRVVGVRNSYVAALDRWRGAKARRAAFFRAQDRARERYLEEYRFCRTHPDWNRCPAKRPAIVDRNPPSVPRQPAAPDASFPEYKNPGHRARS